MMLDPDCGYFNEERDDEYAPPYGKCEECYRYEICQRAEALKLISEYFNKYNAYIISSVDGNGTYIGRLKGLALDADDDLIIHTDIDSVSCTA